jgi:hypothetical protein
MGAAMTRRKSPALPLPPFDQWRRQRFEEGTRGDRALQRIKTRSRWTVAQHVKRHPSLHQGRHRRR